MNRILEREPSLRERVASELLRLVSIGQLRPGALLTEKSVADMFGVSRTPAREALLKLSDSGILVAGTGKGFRVEELTSEDANWLYDCIVGIERQAVLSLSGRPLDKDRLQRAYSESLTRLNGDVFEYWLADRRFHETIVSQSGNPHLEVIADYVRNALSRYIALYLTHEEGPRTSSTEHAAIIEALINDDHAEAAALVTDHWNSARALVTRRLQTGREGDRED